MSTKRKPSTMVDHGKGKKAIVVVLEVPDEKSLEEIKEELELFGCEIKSIEEVVFRANKEGGGCNDKERRSFKTGRVARKNLLR